MRKVDPSVRYARDYNHWLRREADHYLLGLTDWAQYTIGHINQLTDLPTVGQEMLAEQTYLCLQSDKAITELQAPMSCRVLGINEQLLVNPDIINKDCYAAGWLFKISLLNEDDWLTLESSDWYQTEINSLFRK